MHPPSVQSCGGAHDVRSVQCPRYIEETAITRRAFREAIPISQARKQLQAEKEPLVSVKHLQTDKEPPVSAARKELQTDKEPPVSSARKELQTEKGHSQHHSQSNADVLSQASISTSTSFPPPQWENPSDDNTQRSCNNCVNMTHTLQTITGKLDTMMSTLESLTMMLTTQFQKFMEVVQNMTSAVKPSSPVIAHLPITKKRRTKATRSFPSVVSIAKNDKDEMNDARYKPLFDVVPQPPKDNRVSDGAADFSGPSDDYRPPPVQ